MPIGIASLALLFGWLMAEGASPAVKGESLVTRISPHQLSSRLQLGGNMEGRATAEVMANGGGAGKEVLRVTVPELPDATWNVQLQVVLPQPLSPGEVIWFSVPAKTVVPKPESVLGNIQIGIQDTAAPYAAVTQFITYQVAPDWTQIRGAAVVDSKQPVESAAIVINLGFAKQTIDIGEVEIKSYPRRTRLSRLPGTTMPYPWKDPKAPWRQEAARRIEQHRKGDIVIRVVDGKGNPLSGAKVNLKQTRHAFPFGTAVSTRVLMGNQRDPDYSRYRKELVRLFNAAVLENAMKWTSWVNPPERDLAVSSVEWLRQQGMQVRGHNLVWPNWEYMPSSIQPFKDKPSSLQMAIVNHLQDEVPVFANQLIAWDVVNEPLHCTEVTQVVGMPGVVQWFRVVKQLVPNVPLFVNDYDILASNDVVDTPMVEGYLRWIQSVTAAGGPIEGIGIEAHFNDNDQNMTSPEHMLQILDKLGTLGLPIQITEFSLNTTDEQLMADYLHDMLLVAFSHPSVTGFWMWGFWDGAQFQSRAPIFADDFSLKEGGKVWEKLVLGDWWTTYSGTTGAQGSINVRGFLGDYEVTAEVGSASGSGQKASQQFTLTKEGTAVTLTLQ